MIEIVRLACVLHVTSKAAVSRCNLTAGEGKLHDMAFAAMTWLRAQDPDKVALLEQIGEPWKTLIDQAAAMAPPLVISVESGGWHGQHLTQACLTWHAIRMGQPGSLEGGRVCMQALRLDGGSYSGAAR